MARAICAPPLLSGIVSRKSFMVGIPSAVARMDLQLLESPEYEGIEAPNHLRSASVIRSPDSTSLANPPRLTGRRPRPRVPEPQRRRAARACNECRKKKDKCDGQPACERCVRYRIPRSYDPIARPAGSPWVSGDRTHGGRTPEMSESSQRTPSSTKRLEYQDKILAHYLFGRTLSDQEIRELAESLPETQQSSPLVRCVTGSNTDDESNDPPRSAKGSDDDLTLNAFTKTIKSAIVEKLPSYASVIVSNAIISANTGNGTKLDALHAALTCFPPQPISQFLLDVFFRYLQTSIYYVEEAWAYAFLERCYTQVPEVTIDDLPSICTILMVLACGTQFAHLESFQSAEQMAEDASMTPYFSEDDIGQRFHEATRTIMPYILDVPSFRSVQACLMVATYNFPLDSAGASSIYLSLALSHAVHQGLHQLSHNDAAENLVTIEVRRRVWWTVYILHLQTSMRYGRPSFLSPSDVSAPKPVDLPDLRPLKEGSSFENQRGLIELILMTQSIMNEIAGLRRSNETKHILNLFEIRRKLTAWWSRVCEERKAREGSEEMTSRELRNDIHLQLYYWNTCISLGRPFLMSSSATWGPSPSQSATGGRPLLGIESLVQNSIDGALEVINLCQTLRDRVGLARASYSTEFTSCRTAMLVMLAQGLMKPSPKVRETLSRGLSILKVMAIGSKLAHSEVRAIEVLERAVIRLEGAASSRLPDPVDPRLQGKNNYDTFKAWTHLWKASSGFTPPDSSAESDFPMEASHGDGLDTDCNMDTIGDWLKQRGSFNPQQTEREMPLGSFPLELSQFDIISGFDYEFSNMDLRALQEYNN